MFFQVFKCQVQKQRVSTLQLVVIIPSCNPRSIWLFGFVSFRKFIVVSFYMSFETKNDETCIIHFTGGLKVKQGSSGNEKGRVVRRVWFLSWFSGYLMRVGCRKISLRPSGAAGEGRNHHSPPPPPPPRHLRKL